MIEQQDSRQPLEYEGESELRVGLFQLLPCRVRSRVEGRVPGVGLDRVRYVNVEDVRMRMMMGTRCRVDTNSVLGWK